MKRPFVFIVIVLTILSSCEEKGKMTKLDKNERTGVSRSSSSDNKARSNAFSKNELHTVVVNEILPTQKYIYLNVNEGERQFWIAALKQNIEVGKRYIFKGGLLKTNFESKEYNRMFEEIYLVKNLVPDHGNVMDSESQATPLKSTEQKEVKADELVVSEKIDVVIEGSIRIDELVKNPEKYEGKTIQLSGICFKINPNIMKRNWIHLKDGSKDDYDLIITSDVFIPEGTEVTMSGVVGLNKDFGAGYKYDLIIENGILIK